MQGLCLGALLAMVLAASGPAVAGECAGKLERVDLSTVTVVSAGNQKIVLTVDPKDRHKAAPFLGKSVTVKFRQEQGTDRLVVVQGCSFPRATGTSTGSE